MAFNPPPPYPGAIDPVIRAAYPVTVSQDVMYPALPRYGVTMVEPVPVVTQPVIQPVIRTRPVMVINPVVVHPGITDISSTMTCPYCQQNIFTATKSTNGCLVWLIFVILFILGLWPCCLIPFCVKSCKDIQHFCPNCKNLLHIHRRI